MGVTDRDGAADEPLEPPHGDIALRAYHLSYLPNAGTDEENWVRARLELRHERQLIAARAAEIARSARGGTDEENWVLAERELDPSLRAGRVYRTKVAYLEGSRRARDVEQAQIAERASAIAATASGESDVDNWIRAERQVRAEHRLIAEHAHGNCVGSPKWHEAARELVANGEIPLRHDV